MPVFSEQIKAPGHVTTGNRPAAELKHCETVEDIRWEVSEQTSALAPPNCASSGSCEPVETLWASPRNLQMQTRVSHKIIHVDQNFK